jgi:hypothetical protein
MAFGTTVIAGATATRRFSVDVRAKQIKGPAQVREILQLTA